MNDIQKVFGDETKNMSIEKAQKYIELAQQLIDKVNLPSEPNINIKVDQINQTEVNWSFTLSNHHNRNAQVVTQIIARIGPDKRYTVILEARLANTSLAKQKHERTDVETAARKINEFYSNLSELQGVIEKINKVES